jgi:hypothetical protein
VFISVRCAVAPDINDSFLLSTDVIDSLLLHSCCGDACVQVIRRTPDDDEGEGSSEDGTDREGSGHDSGAESTSGDDNVTTQGSSGRGSVGIWFGCCRRCDERR